MDKQRIRRSLEVLLVEDNRADRQIIRQLLSEFNTNHRLSEVEDGEDALDVLNQRGKFADVPRPDLILLDLNLPRMAGVDLLRRVRADQALRTIPVIVLTSSQSPRDVNAAYQAGANLYLRKPADLQGLEDLLRGVAQTWFQHALLPSPNGA